MLFGLQTLAQSQVQVRPASESALPPAAQEALNKGVVAAKIPDYPLAIRFFEDARKIAPAAPVIYLNLGLAESKIPGRELRAIAWFGAYLAADPKGPNTSAIKEKITEAVVKNQSIVLRFVKTAQDAASQIPSDNKSSALFNTTLLWLQLDDLAAAQKSTDLIQDEFYRGVAQRDIVSAQTESGDIAGAQKTADGIQFSLMKTEALIHIAEAKIKTGDLAGAKKTLTSAVKIADLIDRDPDSLIVSMVYMKSKKQSAIAKAQAQAGDIPAALKTVDLIKDEFQKCGAQTAIAEAQIEAGDSVGAQRTLASALKTADLLDVENGQAKVVAQTDIAKAQFKNSDIAGAQKTTAAAQTNANFIEEPGRKGRALLAIASTQAAMGDIAGGQMTANLIQDLADKSEAETAIAEAQIKSGDRAGAQKSLASALQTANLIKGDESGRSLWFIAQAQVMSGDIAAAQKTTDLIQDANYRTDALSAISNVQSEFITVSAWLKRLDDNDKANKCPLNTGPFLDLDSYLKSLTRSDAQGVFNYLHETGKTMVAAQNVITAMLKRQAGK